jgi:hypothetical protein
MPIHATTNAGRWNGLVLGLLIAVMAHMTAASDARRSEEPWPTLLAGEPAGIDPELALLHQRASGSLEKLVQAARSEDRPL